MNSRQTRGMVHVIPNSHGGVYEVDDDMKITIRQIEVHFEQGQMIKNVKEIQWITDLTDLRTNSCLPGNIYQVFTTEQITDDPEEHLLWVSGKVVRTSEGKPVYSYCYYNPCSEYLMFGELPEEQLLIEII